MKLCQLCSGPSLHKDEKILGRKHIYLPHAQTAIYDSKVKLFLKQGISRQLGRGWTQLFDLNARIQQLTWSLIFYEKYSTSQSDLWFWNFHWLRAIGSPLISNIDAKIFASLLFRLINANISVNEQPECFHWAHWRWPFYTYCTSHTRQWPWNVEKSMTVIV